MKKSLSDGRIGRMIYIQNIAWQAEKGEDEK